MINHYQPCCVKARGLFCRLEIGLGLMWPGGICSADSAHRYRFPDLVSGYTNPGQAWAFTIGRGMAELVGLLPLGISAPPSPGDRNLALGHQPKGGVSQGAVPVHQ
jgi:hypothetical protein